MEQVTRHPEYGVRSTTGRIQSGFSRDGAIKAVTGGDDYRSVAGPAPNLLGGEVVVRYDEDTPSGRCRTTAWQLDVSATLAVATWWAHKAQSAMEQADDHLSGGDSRFGLAVESVEDRAAAYSLHQQLAAIRVSTRAIDSRIGYSS